MANFKITDAFSLMGRGDVLIGEILNGEINPGNIACIVINNNLIKPGIKSVEYVVHGENKLYQIALIIAPVDIGSYKDQLVGQIINVLNE